MSMILTAYSAVKRYAVVISASGYDMNPGSSGTATITVNIPEIGKKYSGDATVAYSNFTGPASVTFVDGTASLSLSRNNVYADASFTVTIPQGHNNKEGSATYSSGLSGKEVYIAGNTYGVDTHQYTGDETWDDSTDVYVNGKRVAYNWRGPYKRGRFISESHSTGYPEIDGWQRSYYAVILP